MELDLRSVSPAGSHAQVYRAFRDLSAGEQLTLVADRDLREIRSQFERDFARSFSWQNLESGPELWRVDLHKTASTALPQVLGNASEFADSAATDAMGVRWKIEVSDRDLDSNLIAVAPGEEIAAHTGPGIDVLMIILDGCGTVGTETDELAVKAGDLTWLPKYSRRAIRAGSMGLRYLTVHTHKTGLQITRP